MHTYFELEKIIILQQRQGHVSLPEKKKKTTS